MYKERLSGGQGTHIVAVADHALIFLFCVPNQYSFISFSFDWLGDKKKKVRVRHPDYLSPFTVSHPPSSVSLYFSLYL
jgi:hypothetical protein